MTIAPPALRLLVALAALSAAAGAPAQETSPFEPVDFSTIEEREQAIVTLLLQSPDWPFRVFGILRLERYDGASVEAYVTRAIADDEWPVRAFALRAAARLGLEIDPELLAGETEPRVVRAALRAGVDLPDDMIARGARTLVRTRAIDDLLLGLEIAAASDVEELRAESARRVMQLIRGMDDGVALLVSRRLGLLLGLEPAPETAMQWKAWLLRTETVTLPEPTEQQRRLRHRGVNQVARMELEMLARLRDYLGALRQRELEMVIVMDSTFSMLPMINEARAGVDELILFLSDLSKTMRLAFVAYRDHDNPPVWEGHPFTSDVASIREFLFNVRITGGADLPEAVLDGLTACRELEWTGDAERQIVLIGDAPPHEKDLYKVANLLENYRNDRFTVHAVHVPEQRELGDYNVRTGEIFAEIARLGGGQKVTLIEVRELVPSIMRFTIEASWWPVFEEFYELYLEVCR